MVADNETDQKIKTIISDAMHEVQSPLEDQQARDYRAAFSLVNSTMGLWTKNHKGEIAGEKVVLTLYCFFELLNARDIVSFSEDSPLAAIMDWMLSVVDPDDPVTAKRLINAGKDAKRFLETLQEKGYFHEHRD